MKKFMIFMTLILAISCGGPKIIQEDGRGEVMKYTMNGIYSKYSLDSMIMADTLPPIEFWLQEPLMDFEGLEKTIRYGFIKYIGDEEVVYKVENVGSSYIITKRETTSND